MKKETMTSIGAMTAALLAAACCIGPIVFVLFGASFAFLGKLSFMEQFRPFFHIRQNGSVNSLARV